MSEETLDRTVQKPDTSQKALNKILTRLATKLQKTVDSLREGIKDYRVEIDRPYCLTHIACYLAPDARIRWDEGYFDIQIHMDFTYRGKSITFDKANERLNTADDFSSAVYRDVLKYMTEWLNGSVSEWITEAKLDEIISQNIDKLNTQPQPEG